MAKKGSHGSTKTLKPTKKYSVQFHVLVAKKLQFPDPDIAETYRITMVLQLDRARTMGRILR